MTTSGEIFYPCTDCGSIQKHNFAIHLLSYNVGNGSERSSLIATEQGTTLSWENGQVGDPNLHFSDFLFPRLIILLETTQQIVFKARDLSLTRRATQDSETVDRDKWAILIQTKTCREVDGGEMFLEHSFTLVGPRDYFDLVNQFSKLQSHCKCLYLTPTPNPKPGLEWASMHSLEGWMRSTHKKEIALSKYIARHHKLGSLQCRSSCPAISEKKEGLCQSPRELWVQWGIQHQASIGAWVPSVTGDKIRYLEQDVTGER